MFWLIGALGIVIGITAGLVGAGPSIFTVLVLLHVAGLDLLPAITTSLVVVAVTSSVALVPYARSRAVLWKVGVGFSVASTTGAYVAGRVSGLIPTTVLMVAFVLAMGVSAVAMLVRRSAPPNEGVQHASPRALVAVAAAAVLVGTVTGTVGLGGGFAVVPLLVLVVHAPMRSAVGTSLFVIAMDTLASLAGHASHLRIDWPLAACLAATASAGSLMGAKLGGRVDAGLLRRIFGVLMLAAAVTQLVSSIASERGRGTGSADSGTRELDAPRFEPTSALGAESLQGTSIEAFDLIRRELRAEVATGALLEEGLRLRHVGAPERRELVGAGSHVGEGAVLEDEIHPKQRRIDADEACEPDDLTRQVLLELCVVNEEHVRFVLDLPPGLHDIEQVAAAVAVAVEPAIEELTLALGNDERRRITRPVRVDAIDRRHHLRREVHEVVVEADPDVLAVPTDEQVAGLARARDGVGGEMGLDQSSFATPPLFSKERQHLRVIAPARVEPRRRLRESFGTLFPVVQDLLEDALSPGRACLERVRHDAVTGSKAALREKVAPHERAREVVAHRARGSDERLVHRCYPEEWRVRRAFRRPGTTMQLTYSRRRRGLPPPRRVDDLRRSRLVRTNSSSSSR